MQQVSWAPGHLQHNGVDNTIFRWQYLMKRGILIELITARARLNIKTFSPGLRIPIMKTRRPHLYIGNPYSGQTLPLYWDSPRCRIYVPMKSVIIVSGKELSPVRCQSYPQPVLNHMKQITMEFEWIQVFISFLNFGSIIGNRCWHRIMSVVLPKSMWFTHMLYVHCISFQCRRAMWIRSIWKLLCLVFQLYPLLLTWFNFNPSMDK